MNYGEKRADGSNCGPHALTTISWKPEVITNEDLAVTYTDFRKIKTINEGLTNAKQYTVTYGVDDQRLRSDYSFNSTTKTRYYLGDYEEETDNLGNVKKIHYLSGGAMMISDNNVETLYYGYTDNQGSLVALTDQNGNVVEKYAYDPWGARRNPTDWRYKDTRSDFITNRGYTGHEHLDMFNIINMNGRVYDPLTAMFFSPDPFIQAPENWLNYNRYGYCMNNPTRYTDPSGYQWDVLDMPKEGDAWVNHAMGGAGSGFVGDGSYIGNLMAAFWSASFSGYNNGFYEFKNSFDKETENPNFRGSFTLHYTSGSYLEGKSHYDENKNWVLPELTMIGHSVTIKVGNGTSDKRNGQNSQNYFDSGNKGNIVTSVSAIASIYKKLPSTMNPIISTHYGNLNFKGGKLIGKIAIAGNIVSTFVTVDNIYNDPSKVENYSDALFTGIGWIPVYGDFGAILYMGAKDQISILKENVLNNRDPNSGVYVPATGDVWIYN